MLLCGGPCECEDISPQKVLGPTDVSRDELARLIQIAPPVNCQPIVL